MKKITAIVMSLGLAFGIQAQDESSSSDMNKMFIGGQAGFSSDANVGTDANGNTNDGVAVTSYMFGPTFCYMFNGKMGLGVNLFYMGSNSKLNNGSNDVVSRNALNFQPFFRYYFLGGEKFKLFADARLTYASGGSTTTSDVVNNERETKYTTIGFGIFPGAQYWFTDSWSIAADIGNIGYTGQTTEDVKADTKETDVGLDFKVNMASLNFSLFYHF